MAGLRFSALVEAFVGWLEREGETVLTAGSTEDRPAELRVSGKRCLLFLWTITPGGGKSKSRPPNERRVQLTNVDPIMLMPGVRTIFGGWSEEVGVFAFWDARRHTRFSTKSPSVQVHLRTLEAASRDGIATQYRPTRGAGGNEVVVALRPELLAWYVADGSRLHDVADEADSVAGLIGADPQIERAFLDEAATEDAVARRYELIQTMQAFRSARFRPAVLQAYSYRCAVCGISLKLVDAAHIVPVAYPESTDDVTNGIALCKLHHAAYDSALIGILPDRRILLHQRWVDRLKTTRLDAGLEEFKSSLPEMIRVPAGLEIRPTERNLRIGMVARGWPSP